MLHERGQGHVKWGRQLASGGGAVAQAFQYRAAGIVCQGMEDQVVLERLLRHLPKYTRLERSCQG